MEASNIVEKRFPIAPESMELMQKAKGIFLEFKQDSPELSGLTFFGSRTKGREKPTSDLDVVIFYDSNKVENPELQHEKLLNIRNKISESLGIELGSHVGWEKNISIEKTDLDIYDYIRLANTLSTSPREEAIKVISKNPIAQNLFSRFFLGIGEDLYKNRSYILNQFSGASGDKEFGLLMDGLALFEADNRVNTLQDSYRKLPKTVEDARQYFLTEPTLS